MILVDTSAWVEFLRGTGSDTALEVGRLLRADFPLGSCDPVRMELLAGGRNQADLHDIHRLLQRPTVLGLTPRHYDDAAQLYRRCTSAGETVTKMFDCLIAACAVVADASVLHQDVNFDVLARHTRMRSAAR